jgi:hypothetical protein
MAVTDRWNIVVSIQITASLLIVEPDTFAPYYVNGIIVKQSVTWPEHTLPALDQLLCCLIELSQLGRIKRVTD